MVRVIFHVVFIFSFLLFGREWENERKFKYLIFSNLVVIFVGYTNNWAKVKREMVLSVNS